MKISKRYFYIPFTFCVAVLLLVKCTSSVWKPWLHGTEQEQGVHTDCGVPVAAVAADVPTAVQVTLSDSLPVASPHSFFFSDGTRVKNKIYSVASYTNTFPDLQEVQFEAARKYGVPPIQNREEAEKKKKQLVYIGSNPYYKIDDAMTSSIPYLVPRAQVLLHDISRTFLDSLAIKGIPLHKIIVSSVLRTEEDVEKLRRHNGNASEQSCHRFGTTIDICYNRFETVSNPDEEPRRSVRSDSLKWVLSEVLRDFREAGRCYVKYEVKQGCFHITTR
jgi:uncharacterized protein YcbK (DUF882 family)